MSITGTVKELLAVGRPEPDGESVGMRQRGIPESIQIPISDALRLLENDRRRLTIRIVAQADRDGQATDVGRLAEGIASFEFDCAPNELNAKQRKRVYVSLYQGHVKKLDAVGALDVDDPQHPDDVHATELTHRLDALLETLEDVFDGPRGTPCPVCGTPMMHALPNGGEAAPCGCELDTMQGQASVGVTWQ